MREFYAINLFNKKLLFFCAVVVLAVPLFGQNRVVDKANEFYRLNQYSDAATLFEQALDEMDESRRSGQNALSLKTKLAFCYRMNNKMEKAEALYAEIVQAPNARTDTYYYYGEALMSNGKYDEARTWFLNYQKLQPNDDKASLMIEACDKAPYIMPYFLHVDVEEFAHNSSADDNAPIAWNGGILFSSDREQGMKLLKEKSGWTGRDYLDLYFSEKNKDGSYGEPKKFSSKLSEVNKNTGNASIMADGSEMFFTRNDNVLNKQSTYNLQIYSAKPAGRDRWKNVEKLPFCSPNFNFMHPGISPDGSQLFFVSNRTGGQGGTDIWVSQRTKAGWGKPENLGSAINTSANEGFPFVDGEGRLYFCSKGHPGFGGFDIFVAEKDEQGNWQAPLNLGKPFNSTLDDISIYVAPDRQSGMFTSSRNGGDDDIFLFQILDQAPPGQAVNPPLAVEPVQPLTPVQPEVRIEEKQPVETPSVHPAPVEKEQKNESVAETRTQNQGAVVNPGEASTNSALTPKPKEKQDAQKEQKPRQENRQTAQTTEEPKPEIEENPTPPTDRGKRMIPDEPRPQKEKERETPVVAENQVAQKQEAPNEKPEGGAAEKKPDQSPKERPSYSPFLNEPVFPEDVAEKKKEEPSTGAQSSDRKQTIAENPTAPAGRPQLQDDPEATALVALSSFEDLITKLEYGNLKTGDHFRLGYAVYDPNVWQLTPPIAAMLDQVANIMRHFPSLVVEIGAYTETLGNEADNLRLSQNRAEIAIEYLESEGISKKRLLARGYGETAPLNHCYNGVKCTMEEHLFNQRLEARILRVEGGD